MSFIQSTWYRTFAGMALVFAGLGLCRFAYAAWVPVMLRDDWVSIHAAGYIGTSISVGAFIGFLLIHRILKTIGQARTARLTMIGAVLVLGAQIWLPGHAPGQDHPPALDSLSFWWLMGLRFCCGFVASLSFSLGPAFVIENVQKSNHPVVIGIAVSGGGVGAVLASLLMPWSTTMIEGPAGGEVMVTVLALIATIVAWPAFSTHACTQTASAPEIDARSLIRLPLILIMIGMVFLLIGTMPIAVYAAAYLNLERGLSTSESAMVFSIFGLGALLGGPVFGSIITRLIGGRIASIISASLGILAALTFVLDMPLYLTIPAVGVIGLIFLGHASLPSARVFRYAGDQGHLKAWSWCVISLGAGSIVGTFAVSAIIQTLGHDEGFRWMYILSLISMVILLVTHASANMRPLEEKCA